MYKHALSLLDLFMLMSCVLFERASAKGVSRRGIAGCVYSTCAFILGGIARKTFCVRTGTITTPPPPLSGTGQICFVRYRDKS